MTLNDKGNIPTHSLEDEGGGGLENIKWMVRVHSQVEKDRRHDKKGKLQV